MQESLSSTSLASSTCGSTAKDVTRLRFASAAQAPVAAALTPVAAHGAPGSLAGVPPPMSTAFGHPGAATAPSARPRAARQHRQSAAALVVPQLAAPAAWDARLRALAVPHVQEARRSRKGRGLRQPMLTRAPRSLRTVRVAYVPGALGSWCAAVRTPHAYQPRARRAYRVAWHHRRQSAALVVQQLAAPAACGFGTARALEQPGLKRSAAAAKVTVAEFTAFDHPGANAAFHLWLSALDDDAVRHALTLALALALA